MKVLKTITAIMFSIMMVLGMSSVVSAAGASGTGKIKINNAVVDQTYNIYKILDLESYDATTGNYAYKPATNEWKDFLNETGIIGTYVEVD